MRNYIGVDSEYYDDEVFGRSVEEDTPLSPSLSQFIYNRGGPETEPEYGQPRASVDCVQEEEEEEGNADEEALNTMYDMGFEMDLCKDALRQYDNDMTRALNHVLENGAQQHVQEATVPAGRPVHQEQLATELQNRLQVGGSGDTTPTNCLTPVKCNTPKSNTPRSGSPPAIRRPPREPTSANTTPKAKKSRPKDIDVLGILNSKVDTQPLINVAVVGHVDAGKSTLMGHLLCLLDHVSKKELHKNKTESQKLGKGSFAYAWVLDETGEERERGVTIDVAQTRFQTPKKTVNLLDAPGHKDFVPNMISGAAQADFAILVVDSTPGGFEAGFEQGGQTREHVVLVRALGVQTLIVAVNKMENVAWGKERYDHISGELSVFLKTVGFKNSEVIFVPVSGLEGDNLMEKSITATLTEWYSGGSLVDIIDGLEAPKRCYDRPFRLIVTDVFKHPQMGLSVAGKVDSGFVIMGTPVVIMPGGTTAMIKSMTTVDDKSVDYSVAGEQCILVVGGTDQTKIHNGNVICESQSRVRTTLKFKARVLVFNIDIPITKGFPIDLHYQTVNEPAVISRLISTHSKSNGQVLKSKPRCLTKNQVALIEIKCERAICLELFKDSKSLGRITCRYGGNTIAAGMVIEIT